MSKQEKIIEKGISMPFDLIEEITPKNQDLVTTIKKEGRPKKTKNLDMDWDKEIDPLKNCNMLITYFRNKIKSFDEEQTFNATSVDRIPATEILDLLIKNKRKSVGFLNSWIRYFFDTKISGKTKHPENVSIKNFKKTFSEFNIKYLE